MNPSPRMVLKQSTGWFAAGWQFGEALLTLSDAAFKLFAWLCLNADRHTGQSRIPVAEISRELRKPETWTQEALQELRARGVCQGMGMVVEITDSYWPYEKQSSGEGSREYVAQVRQMLLAPGCVRCRFTPADEKLACDLHRRGVRLTQIQRAILLGCARKYTTLLGNGAAWTPIVSLSYFTVIIEEVCRTSSPDSYWAYIQRRFGELERQWLSRTGGSANQSAG
jgi:DNA-binding Lrp family transcriptional regulator